MGADHQLLADASVGIKNDIFSSMFDNTNLLLREPRPAMIGGPAIAMSDLVPADCFISPAYSV